MIFRSQILEIPAQIFSEAVAEAIGDGEDRGDGGVRMGKPWENHGKMWVLMGFNGIYPLVMTNSGV